METELNYSDQIIEKIDNELLNLYYASQKKTEYQFFDFYKALQTFNKSVLKEGGREKYFKLRAKQFRDVFSDLLFTESKVSFYETKRYNPNSRIERIKVTTCITNEVGRKRSYIVNKVDDEMRHEYLKNNIENLKEKTSNEIRVNKYNYLLEGIQIIDQHLGWERFFKIGFDALFINYNLDIRHGITFEGYIKGLQFQKEELQAGNPTKPTLTGFQSSLTDPQIQTLFELLKGSYIDKNTNPDHFKAIFRNKPLPKDIKIQWIDKGKTRHEPNKQTLFEFLYLLKEYGYLNNTNFDTTPDNKNNLYRKLETIFPDLLNFGNSNPFNPQKNTARQKELEIIIQSLKS